MTARTARADAVDRRRDLIAATVRSIAEHGFADATVERICAAAGVSRGLISHYFAGKDDLLLATYRQLTDELGAETARVARARGGGPVDKLRAAIEASFRPPVFDFAKVSVWVAFWSEARTRPDLRALNRDLYRGYRAAIARLMAEAARERGIALDAHGAAVALTALIDGLWLEWSLDPDAFSPEIAETVCLDYLDGLFVPRAEDDNPGQEDASDVP